MHTLCNRVENGLSELKVALQKHIARQGEEALERIADVAVNVREFLLCLVLVRIYFDVVVCIIFTVPV